MSNSSKVIVHRPCDGSEYTAPAPPLIADVAIYSRDRLGALVDSLDGFARELDTAIDRFIAEWSLPDRTPDPTINAGDTHNGNSNGH
jgi:hypothetical protein